MSNHAETAKMIRQDLKKAFPNVKFSVKSDRYSGGSSVSINWTNGPNRDSVNELVCKYQYGSFDGQQDLYEINNSRKDIPQVQYVQTSREISEQTKYIAFAWLKKRYPELREIESIYEYNSLFVSYFNVDTAAQFIHRLLAKENLTNGFQGV